MKHIFYIFFFFVSIINSQNLDKIEVTYFDLNQKITNKENASYYEFKTLYKDEIFKYQKYFISSPTKVYLVEKYYFDKEGKKQGKYKSYFKTGTIKEQGIYLNNKKEGQWKFYDSCKKHNDTVYISLISRELSYSNNKKHGNFKEYHYTGTIFREGQYSNDNLIGLCKWYYFVDQLQSLEMYDKNGKLIKIKQWGVFGNKKTKNLQPMSSNESRINELKGKIYIAMIHNFDIHANMRPKKNVGKIYLKLLIDKEGKIHTIKARKTLVVAKVYEDKARQVIDNMSNIEPFYSKGKLIDMKLSFYINVSPRVVKTL